MDVLVLRLLMDASFFMAIFNPLIAGEHAMLRWSLLAVLAVWMIWLVGNWKKKDLEGRVQDVAFMELKAMVVIQVYEVVLQGITKWQNRCAPYVVVFVVAAILFLRAGRLIGGSQEKRKFWGANGAELFLIFAGVLVLSSEFMKSMAWKLVSGVYMSVILPILMLFLNLLQLVFMLLEPLFALLLSGVDTPENEVQLSTNFSMELRDLVAEEGLAETPLWVKIVGAVVLIVIFGIIFFFMYKKLSVEGSGKNRDIQGQVKKTALTAAERKAEKRHSMFEEKNVRHYYRKFSELCRKYCVQPEHRVMTTELIREITVANWGEEESIDQLTELYRDVRYGGRSDGDEEKKTARSIFKKMKDVASEKIKN